MVALQAITSTYLTLAILNDSPENRSLSECNGHYMIYFFKYRYLYKVKIVIALKYFRFMKICNKVFCSTLDLMKIICKMAKLVSMYNLGASPNFRLQRRLA